MLPFKPLGQHHFLARRPLGQSLSLGLSSPLGVSRATIAQTFPVLQLSLEQSARSSQADMFWDGFIVSPSESGFTSSFDRSRSDQPSTVSPPTSPASVLQSSTVDRTTPQKSTFPENLSLLSRKPLTAPEPLGGLLPLEQLSEQSSLSPIDPQQASLPHRLQASSSSPESSEPEPPIADVLASSATQMIQPSLVEERPSLAVTPETTNAAELSISQADSSQADSAAPLALPEVAQTIPVQRQPSIPSLQALQQTTKPSAISRTDGLSESHELSESDGFNERVSETQPSLNQIVETQSIDTLQPSVAAETLAAETLETESLETATTIDALEADATKSTAIDAQPHLRDTSIADPPIADSSNFSLQRIDAPESDASMSTAIDAQTHLGDASIADLPIADPSNFNLQRSVDRQSTISTPSIPEADTAPSVSVDTQQVGGAEGTTDLVPASQTLQSETTELESTPQIEPTAIAPSDESIATQQQSGQPTATPIDANPFPVNALQRRLEIEDSVDVASVPIANLPIQDDRSDTTTLSSSEVDNSTLEPTSAESTRPQTESPAAEKRQSVTESLVQPVLDREPSETGSPVSMKALSAAPTNDATAVMPIATERSETLVDRPTEGAIQTEAVSKQVVLPIELSSVDTQDSLQRRDETAIEPHSPTEISLSESSDEQPSAMQPDSGYLPSLVNAAPLVSNKSLLTPSLPLTAPLMESTLNSTPMLERTTTPSTDQPIDSPESTTIAQPAIAHESIARKQSASSELTAPTVAPAGATPDSWSSLTDLLSQSTLNQPETRSWQDVVADLSDTSPTPSIQRQAFEEAETVDTMAGNPSEPITLLNGTASEQIAAKPVSEAPAPGQSKATSDEQLDQLALTVYSRLRMQLEIDRERHGMFTTGHQLYLGTVIPAVNFASDQAKSTQKNQQKPDADDKLSPLDAKLDQLTGEIHYLLRSHIEIAQERYGRQARLPI